MKTLIKIWKSKWLILAGFWNKLFKTDRVERVYKKRMSICMACPKLDTKGQYCMVVGTQPCCNVCGCSLSMKLRSMDSDCPHPEGPKWKEEKV